MVTHSGILAWEHGQRNLAGYSPWGHKSQEGLGSQESGRT